jgi:hypothetical protein
LKSGVDWCHWLAEGVFKYEKDGEFTLIEKGKVLKSDVDACCWYAEGVFAYKKDGKIKEVNLNNN